MIGALVFAWKSFWLEFWLRRIRNLTITLITAECQRDILRDWFRGDSKRLDAEFDAFIERRTQPASVGAVDPHVGETPA